MMQIMTRKLIVFVVIGIGSIITTIMHGKKQQEAHSGI
jgi:hypothetical protein